ncbi:Origin recognition complex subunit 5 [Entomophthora muscae]|uniref:Origin recognition complex subunit 5 n=1 Tax=Entomophthora muscae TaxID=34485 RepID=A0ACC2REZ3_9FUNG|nr:Origin recognition complex subunit 5 [Entomophthora muscae]
MEFTQADNLTELLAKRKESTKKLNDLSMKYHGRQEQIFNLDRLIGRGSCKGPEVAYIWGDVSSGKSAVVRSYFESLHATQNEHVFLNCTEAFTPKSIFERILNTFNCSYPTFPPTPSAKSYIKCSQLPSFIELLSSVISKRPEIFTWYLVFDQVEKIRDATWSFLPVLFKLSEKTGGNFSIILIGKVPWENVRPSIGVRDPVVVHFPEYSKEELVEILARTSPHTLPPFRGSIKKNGAVFRGFAALLYDTAYSSCRNLTEMQHLATQIYPVFVKPLLDDPTRVLSLLELYSIAKPHFEKATQAIYARNISLTHEASVKGKSPSLLHLPHYSKFLLVASYLASYNPAKSDMEYFYRGAIPGQGTKRQRITHSTAKQAAKKSKIAPQLLGPQPFTLERMLAIFYSIVDDPNLTTTVHIDTQIATLASLQLLTPMGVKSGHAAKLAQLKYKAALPLDATKLIAQQLDFPLDKYLYSDDT